MSISNQTKKKKEKEKDDDKLAALIFIQAIFTNA